MWVEVFHEENMKNRGIDGIVMDRRGAATRFANLPASSEVDELPPATVTSEGVTPLAENVFAATSSRQELVETIRTVIGTSGAMKPAVFADVYASVLSRVSCKRIFEIGIHQGGSARMWRSLLGRDAVIACMDLKEECCHNAEAVANHVYAGSQTDPELLQRIGTEVGPFDVIIDDGSHQNPHMIFSLEQMFSFVRPGGAYVIEDMFTSYWPKYRGGLGKKDALMEYMKRRLDEMYAPFVSQKYKAHFVKQPIPTIEQDALSSAIESVEFFGAGIVVIHKKARVAPPSKAS
jgi:cephalosporin hydroxylase